MRTSEAGSVPVPPIQGWQRRLQRWAMPAWVSLRLAPLLHRVDALVLTLTRDRTCLTSLATGIPVALVRTRGARSGAPKTRPLTALPDGPRLGLFASNFGRPRHPAWYHNLRASPIAEVRRAGRWQAYAARLADAAEHARLWQAAVALYPGYAAYARRAAPRPIPIVILEPVPETGP